MFCQQFPFSESSFWLFYDFKMTVSGKVSQSSSFTSGRYSNAPLHPLSSNFSHYWGLPFVPISNLKLMPLYMAPQLWSAELSGSINWMRQTSPYAAYIVISILFMLPNIKTTRILLSHFIVVWNIFFSFLLCDNAYKALRSCLL